MQMHLWDSSTYMRKEALHATVPSPTECLQENNSETIDVTLKCHVPLPRILRRCIPPSRNSIISGYMYWVDSTQFEWRNKDSIIGMYAFVTYGETTIVWSGPVWSTANSLAVPKSAILGFHSSSSRMLPGLRSLWIILSPDPPCRYAMPCAIPRINSSLLAQFSEARRLTLPVSVKICIH